ncbi:MAG: hypothetical protein L6Q76_03600, partial [Polyangiaceae bacterium]|nr:hypothetical protein [Polyangiaceae bacterium]
EDRSSHTCGFCARACASRDREDGRPLISERQDTAERHLAPCGGIGHRIAVLGVAKIGSTIGGTTKMGRRRLASVDRAPRRSCVRACADEQ